MKIMASDNPRVGVEMLADSGLLQFICPELLRGQNMHQNVKWHALPVWDHVMLTLESCESPDPLIRLALLLHDIAKPQCRAPHPKEEGQFQFLGHDDVGAEMAATWMREMKFSNDEIARVSHLIQHHLVFYEPNWSDARVRRWVRKVGKENVDDVLTVYEADLRGKALPVEERLHEIAQLRRRAESVFDQVISSTNLLNISGHDVISILGLERGGPEVGQCLRWLTEKVTDEPELNERETLLQLAREFSTTF